MNIIVARTQNSTGPPHYHWLPCRAGSSPHRHRTRGEASMRPGGGEDGRRLQRSSALHAQGECRAALAAVCCSAAHVKVSSPCSGHRRIVVTSLRELNGTFSADLVGLWRRFAGLGTRHSVLSARVWSAASCVASCRRKGTHKPIFRGCHT